MVDSRNRNDVSVKVTNEEQAKETMFSQLSFSIICMLLPSSAVAADPAPRPNVIVVLTDDQGYGDMACHGNPWLKTPEIDRLAAESVRLTDFHVDPTCSPTRSALMTGRYSARTGVWLTYASRHHLRRDEITMADVFKQNGYRTAVFGKWHLGDNYPFRPMDRGFDESLIHGGGVIGETPDRWDNNYYDGTYFRNGKPEKVRGYCTDVWFNEAIRFIAENKDRPFFLYLPTNAAHGPLHVPQEYSKPYAEHKRRGAFYGMIANIDENLGRLRDHLQRQSLERKTILVFLTDNGTATGVTLSAANGDTRNGWTVAGYNAGMRGRKTSAYEGGHRAACFVHWPGGGLTGGREVDGVTAHIDLLPTLIDLCGLEFEDTSRFDGTSLAAALLKGGAAPADRSVVVHHQGRFGQEVGEGRLIKDKDYSVMKNRWRLVGDELYDLDQDPSQKEDVASRFPEIAAQLRQDYESWWSEVSQRADEFCPFVINPAKQRVVKISSQNLMGSDCAYSQRHVRSGMPVDGWTVIDVEAPGRYRISLRRWPKEADAAIRSTVPPCPMDPSTHQVKDVPCVAIDAVAARLKVGSFDKTLPVHASDKEVVFETELAKGEQRIQAWFTTKAGEQTAAYYTYLEPIQN